MLISFGNLLEEHFFLSPCFEVSIKRYISVEKKSFKSSPFQQLHTGPLHEFSGPSVPTPTLSERIRPSFFPAFYTQIGQRTKAGLKLPVKAENKRDMVSLAPFTV